MATNTSSAVWYGTFLAVYAHFDRDLNRLVVWANQANATQFARIAPIFIQRVKHQTPLAVTLIQQAARDIDRLVAQSIDKPLPCSLLAGLAQFIEPLLGNRCGGGWCPASWMRFTARS